jgi:hypothetical protein
LADGRRVLFDTVDAHNIWANMNKDATRTGNVSAAQRSRRVQLKRARGAGQGRSEYARA